MEASQKIRRQLFLGTAMLGSLFLGYGRRAYAGSCTGAGGTYVCSGAAGGADVTQNLTGAPLTVTTNPGFGIITTAGDAIDLTANGGGLTFHDDNASEIKGEMAGISAQNNVSGALLITSTGSVIGDTGPGINAVNNANGTNLTIDAYNVHGATNGIFANNLGTGALSITATGGVSGGIGAGINAHNSVAGTNLTIQAASVSEGVYGYNKGSGALSITTTGTVTGPAAAIGAYVNGGTNLTVSATKAYGGRDGIFAQSFGTGAMSITATGNVNGAAGYGIHAYNNGGTSLTIQAAQVTGHSTGVFAQNVGVGATSLSITTTGIVTGNTIAGVYAQNKYGTSLTIQDDAAVTGQKWGVKALLGNTGSTTANTLSITENGTVTGKNYYGVLAENFGLVSGSTAIAVTASGMVQGTKAGVYAFSNHGQPIAITNAGTIQNLSGASTDLAIKTIGGPATIVNSGEIIGVVNLADPPISNSLTNTALWNTAGGTNTFGGADSVVNTASGTIIAASPGAAAPVTTIFNGLASFTNAGLLTMHNGVVGDQTIVTGNFIGQGGAVALDTVLGGDNSPTDQLVINGGNASGSTRLLVFNAGGLGAMTVANGIEVVRVENGGTTAAGAFQLGQAVAAGAFAYTLFDGGNAAAGGNPNDQNWYLRSVMTAPLPNLPNYRPEVPVYLAMPELANQLGFAMIDNFDARMGGARDGITLDPSATGAIACKDLTQAQAEKAIHSGVGCQTPAEKALGYKQSRDNEIEGIQKAIMWGRVFGVAGWQKPGDHTGPTLDNDFLNGRGPQYSYSYGGIQAGMDLLHRDGADGSRDRAGLYVGYLAASADVSQIYSGVYASNKAGSVTMNGYSAGAYWTHFGPSGWYVDGVAQGMWFGQAQGQTVNTGMSVDGYALTTSLESGYPLHFANLWTIEPQAQVIYQHLQLGSGSDLYGFTSFGGTDDVRGRIGAKFSYSAPTSANPVTLWLRANLWHDFIGNAPSATFATLTGADGLTLKGSLGGTWGEIDAGVETRLNQQVSLFGSALYDRSLGSGAGWSAGGRLGVKVEY